MDGPPRPDGIEVWRLDHGWSHPYPWMFAVWFGGKRYLYAGMPNQCETQRQAIGRAMCRLKWHRDGTHSRRYQ
jgi:hypothetical protein